jgi:gamma-glutamylcyclotransferase (GGCT)/AIG2-like uncharacterized protein YtfP
LLDRAMLDLIFVYGSLRPDIEHPMSDKLAAEAEWLGRATVPARLYRMSWYPVAKPAVAPDDVMVGDMYRLKKPAESLVWLDAYEGITQDGSSAAEPDAYYRTEVEALMAADRRTLSAWIYFSRIERPETARILSGDWLDAAENRRKV